MKEVEEVKEVKDEEVWQFAVEELEEKKAKRRAVTA